LQRVFVVLTEEHTFGGFTGMDEIDPIYSIP
jgi:hypothetical protein